MFIAHAKLNSASLTVEIFNLGTNSQFLSSSLQVNFLLHSILHENIGAFTIALDLLNFPYKFVLNFPINEDSIYRALVITNLLNALFTAPVLSHTTAPPAAPIPPQVMPAMPVAAAASHADVSVPAHAQPFPEQRKEQPKQRSNAAKTKRHGDKEEREELKKIGELLIKKQISPIYNPSRIVGLLQTIVKQLEILRPTHSPAPFSPVVIPHCNRSDATAKRRHKIHCLYQEIAEELLQYYGYQPKEEAYKKKITYGYTREELLNLSFQILQNTPFRLSTSSLATTDLECHSNVDNSPCQIQKNAMEIEESAAIQPARQVQSSVASDPAPKPPTPPPLSATLMPPPPPRQRPEPPALQTNGYPGQFWQTPRERRPPTPGPYHIFFEGIPEGWFPRRA